MVTGTVNPSVMESGLGNLVLRTRGSTYQDQIIRLKSAKCTIGSGPNCTLRLHGKDLDAVHCLILRGSNGAVIRRWSPNTRLNGQAFTSAPLSPGDRLSIGAMEFDIIATAERAAPLPATIAPHTDQYPQRPSQAQPRENIQEISEPPESRARQLRQQEDVFALRARQLEQTAAALQAEKEQFEFERRQWEAIRGDLLSAASQSRSAVDDKRQTELDVQRAELESRRCELDAQAAALQGQNRELNNLAAELAGKSAEIQARNAELDTRGARIEAREEELQTLATKQDARFAQLDAQAAAFQGQSQELNSLAAELAGKSAEIQARNAELETQGARIKAREEELQTLATKQDARFTQLDAQAAELQTQADARKKQAAELKTQAAELQSRCAELAGRESELEIQRQDWEEFRRNQEKTLQAREEELKEKTSQLETMQARFQEQQEQRNHQLAQREAGALPRTLEPDVRELPAVTSQTIEAPAAKLDAPLPSDISPAKLEDLLHRVRHDIDSGEKEDHPLAETPARAPAPSQERQNETLNQTSPEQSPVHADDESVAEYMARLMDRIRSAQGEISGKTEKPYGSYPRQADQTSIPIETAPSPAAATTPPLAKRREPMELSPRTQRRKSLLISHCFARWPITPLKPRWALTPDAK